MKAGVFTPATLPPRGPELGVRLRSMKAGVFTPATPDAASLITTLADHSLNEGGGLHPRNAATGSTDERRVRDRSMKAGVFTPATRHRRPLQRPPRRRRSMKAGVFTPATPFA